DLDIVNDISEKTPNLCKLSPAGPHHVEDLYMAGGVQAVLNELAGEELIHKDLMTVTGKTVGENIENAQILNREIIRPISNPYSKTGGIKVLHGNLAPDGAVVKQSAVASEMLVHRGPARVFGSEEDAFNAI